jgi:hypothetical protein
MAVKVCFLVAGEAIQSKTMSQVPEVGDCVELGKTVDPRVFLVLHRKWRDSNDDMTRVDVHLEEEKKDVGRSSKRSLSPGEAGAGGKPRRRA